MSEAINVLREVPKGKGCVRIYTADYKDKSYFHVREFFANADDEMCPTQKGIAFEIASPEESEEAINELADSFAELIETAVKLRKGNVSTAKTKSKMK